jgi:hypothetical protein
MTWPIRIVGAVVILLRLLQVAWEHHWSETFAYALALAAWYMASLQQSRIDDAERKIQELERRLADTTH